MLLDCKRQECGATTRDALWQVASMCTVSQGQSSLLLFRALGKQKGSSIQLDAVALPGGTHAAHLIVRLQEKRQQTRGLGLK